MRTFIRAMINLKDYSEDHLKDALMNPSNFKRFFGLLDDSGSKKGVKFIQLNSPVVICRTLRFWDNFIVKDHITKKSNSQMPNYATRVQSTKRCPFFENIFLFPNSFVQSTCSI